MRSNIPLKEKLLLAWNWICLLRNPLDTERVFAMADIGLRNRHREKEMFADMEQEFLNVDGFKAMFEEEYLPDLSQFESLGSLPENTFGRQHYEFMKANNLDPHFYVSIKIEDVFTYLSQYLRQSHDMWHTVLGRGTTIDDEIYIQSFMVGQMGDPLAGAIVAASILHRVNQDPLNIRRLMDHIVDGYQTGKEAKSFLSVRWSDHFEEPLVSLQQRVGLKSA